MVSWKGVFTLGIVVALSACGTSHKAVVGTSMQERDSVRTEQTDSASKSVELLDSISKNVTDILHISTSTAEAGSNEETITERVVETTDTLGNKTTITDRVTRRSGKYDKQSTMDERLEHQEEQMRAIRQRLDSLYIHSDAYTANHWEKADSISQTKEKSAGGDGLSWWQRIKLRASSFLWMALAFALAVSLFKKNKRMD